MHDHHFEASDILTLQICTWNILFNFTFRLSYRTEIETILMMLRFRWNWEIPIQMRTFTRTQTASHAQKNRWTRYYNNITI